MCDPVTAAIVVGVTSVATAGYSVYAQAATAKAQKKALNQQVDAAAADSRRQTSAELFDSMREARREQGRVRTQAGEAGLSLTSGSVEAMLLDSAMQGELRQDTILANAESRNSSNSAEAASMASRISTPNVLSAGLQLGSAAVSGWSGIQNAKIKAS